MDDIKRELEDYFCRFTFGQFVTLILLEIVTLFFVFYLGAKYGPDLMGTRQGIAKDDSSVLPHESKSIDELVGTPSVEYTYPEVLTDQDQKRGIRVKPSGLTAEEYEKRGREQKAVITEETPIEVPTIEVKKEPPAPPAPEVTTSQPTGKYSIQVGSYQSEEEANAKVGLWKEKGYSAFMEVGQIPDKGIWYRVRIGGFPTREKAQEFLDQFKTKEKTEALVVLSNS